MRALIRRPLGALGWTLAAAIPLCFVGLFFLWPVAALVATGLTDGAALDLGGIPEVLGLDRSWRVLGNTLTQASLATALAILLGVPAAYVLYRLEFRGRGVLRAILTVPFVLPAVVVGVAFTALYGPGGALHWLGLDRSLTVVVLALAFFNVTVVARTVGGYWAQLDTRQGQAARTLGGGPVRVFMTVTLPALGPALASAAALVFLFCATSFGVVLILGGREFANIETEIYRLTVQFLDLRSAAVLSLVQFAIVTLALGVSAILRGHSERPNEARSEVRPPRRSDAPVIAVFGATVLLLHVLPIGHSCAARSRGPAASGSRSRTIARSSTRRHRRRCTAPSLTPPRCRSASPVSRRLLRSRSAWSSRSSSRAGRGRAHSRGGSRSTTRRSCCRSAFRRSRSASGCC